jgi:hypothetical protein
LRLGGLLGKPWLVKINSIVQDFYKSEGVEVEGIRGNLKVFTLDFVGKLYGLDTIGEVDWLKEDVSWELFFDPSKRDPKFSWKVEHCRIPELKELFAFLLPIFYPIKPHQIMKGFATMLIWAWKYNRKINWAAIMLKNLQKMVSNLHPDKVTYLCPFIAHAYSQEAAFTAE